MMLRYPKLVYILCSALLGLCTGQALRAQAFVAVSAAADAQRVTVGDRINIFLNVQNKPAAAYVQWAQLPDSIPNLEILERGRIDTVRNGEVVYYKQRIVVTGFDSGQYVFPALQFSVIPKSGAPYALTTDSIALLVQTVAVDTTKEYKPIKGILEVRSTWRDYLWLIIGGAVFLVLLGFIIWYFARNKGIKVPEKPAVPAETLQQKAMRLLDALENEQLWQQSRVKEYYIRLTDIVRSYVEARFDMPAMELTTDELVDQARRTKDLVSVAGALQTILQTADLAKFAKAQPTPQEHLDAMERAKEIIARTTPVILEHPVNTTPPKA